MAATAKAACHKGGARGRSAAVLGAPPRACATSSQNPGSPPPAVRLAHPKLRRTAVHCKDHAPQAAALPAALEPKIDFYHGGEWEAQRAHHAQRVVAAGAAAIHQTIKRKQGSTWASSKVGGWAWGCLEPLLQSGCSSRQQQQAQAPFLGRGGRGGTQGARAQWGREHRLFALGEQTGD